MSRNNLHQILPLSSPWRWAGSKAVQTLSHGRLVVVSVLESSLFCEVISVTGTSPHPAITSRHFSYNIYLEPIDPPGEDGPYACRLQYTEYKTTGDGTVKALPARWDLPPKDTTELIKALNDWVDCLQL